VLATPQAAHADGTWAASVKLSTDRASHGDLVTFSGQISFAGKGPDDTDSGVCVVNVGGKRVPTATCTWKKPGQFSGSFAVPNEAATGVNVVSVCWRGCNDSSIDDVFLDYWQANSDLKVGPFVEVPDVLCMPVDDALAQLKGAGFRSDSLMTWAMSSLTRSPGPAPESSRTWR
jgi:hypothetical protein